MNGDQDRQEFDRLRGPLDALAEGAVPRDDCPEPQRIWAAAAGEADPQEFREILDHLAVCPVCREAWALAEEIQPEADRLEATRPARRPWSQVAGIAATLLLVVAVGLIVQREWNPDPTHRGGRETKITVLNKGPLSRENCTLRWEGPPGVTAYEVEVSWIPPGSHFTLLADERELREPTFTVPQDALVDVPSGAVLRWSITALEDGRELVTGSIQIKLR